VRSSVLQCAASCLWQQRAASTGLSLYHTLALALLCFHGVSSIWLHTVCKQVAVMNVDMRSFPYFICLYTYIFTHTHAHIRTYIRTYTNTHVRTRTHQHEVPDTTCCSGMLAWSCCIQMPMVGASKEMYRDAPCIVFYDIIIPT